MAGGSPCDDSNNFLQTLILRLDPAHKRIYVLCAREAGNEHRELLLGRSAQVE